MVCTVCGAMETSTSGDELLAFFATVFGDFLSV
jgi:hypothetical protein